MAKSSELQQAASRSHSQPVMTSVNPQNPQSMAGTKYEVSILFVYFCEFCFCKQATQY